MNTGRGYLFLIGLLMAQLSWAAAPVVPEPLKPWTDWVLRSDSQWRCPFFQNNYQQKQCVWPGVLQLALTDKGGQFTSQVTVYQEEWVILPGDADQWPQQVRVNNQPATVVEHDIRPALRLAAGNYQITGRFEWTHLPEQLALDPDTGLLNLTINGKAIANPALKQANLWLNSENQKSDSGNSDLDIQVFRKIIDDVPLQIETRLDLQVAGNVREIRLPYVLLQDFIPIALDSDLPVRVDADGQLTVQVRPGRWQISLLARHPQALEQLNLAIEDENWPASELWAFAAMPALRVVEIDLPAIDASQTNLPEEWRSLPTYQMQQGQNMALRVINRGDTEARPNQLNLNRQLWLDFDGAGYSVQDRINGTLTSAWRMNALPELRLGQVSLNGQSQLITQLADQQQGVEVRSGTLNLSADSRIDNQLSELSAVGWQQSFQNVTTQLHLPPGWRLLAVFGVDNQPDAWLTRWSLLDLFLVLITATAIARLWSLKIGLLAAISLLVIWHEPDAPQWIWLLTLAALALLQVLPDGPFKPWVLWYRNLCWLAMVITVLPFMVSQVRVGLYPQLAQTNAEQNFAETAFFDGASGNGAAVDSVAPAAAPEQAIESEQLDRRFKMAPAKSLSKSISASQNFNRIDPDAQTQTGPGLPQWHWKSVQLQWNGAVDSQQKVSFWYLPPWANRLLHFLQALLSVGLALLLLGLANKLTFNGKPFISLALLLPLWAAPVDPAQAQMPDAAMLEQLKSHLLAEPPCLPNCAQMARMTIVGQADQLKIELEIHAQQALAVPLPVAAEQWLPEQVSMDGHATQGLVRDEEGTIWLAVPVGVHQVQLQGRTLPLAKFSLPLPMVPHYVQAQVSGWQIDGLYENGKVGEQLEFNRVQNAASASDPLHQSTAFPAFVRVERTLHLGLDWSISTRVSQIAGSDAPVSLELPLLPGEAVTTQQIRVQNGKVLVNLASADSEQSWESKLNSTDQIQLNAANAAWFEVWRADVSPVWHMELSGIAPIHQQDESGAWLPEWRPWPGESVQLNISRPQAVPGPTLTIDRSDLKISIGKRSESVELDVSLRSSKGGQHSLQLPADAQLQSVSIDGISQPLRAKQQALSLPIHPGAQQIHIVWQTNREQGSVFHTPSVDLGLPSVNSHIQVISGEDRWILFAFGPKLGPAVLFWGWLAVLLVLAYGLGKSGYSPLRAWQWALLLLGLSQVSVLEGLIVVGWLIALDFRKRQQPEPRLRFNAMQVGLALLSVCALVLLFSAVEHGLLGSPDMQIVGNQSSATQLNWMQDRSPNQLPQATVFSLPMMSYRLLMLGWSLWMAVSLMNWLRWGWSCFAEGGLWRKKVVIVQS